MYLILAKLSGTITCILQRYNPRIHFGELCDLRDIYFIYHFIKLDRIISFIVLDKT